MKPRPPKGSTDLTVAVCGGSRAESLLPLAPHGPPKAAHKSRRAALSSWLASWRRPALKLEARATSLQCVLPSARWTVDSWKTFEQKSDAKK